VIVYPTETVYGLGCRASESNSIERIARIKKARQDAPFLILIRDAGQLRKYARQIPPAAERLAQRFWPGPLTLILPARKDLHPRLIGPSGGVGMRVSSHAWCQALLEQLDEALISTSANFTGSPAPRSLMELDQQLGAQADLVIDGGTLPGEVSTILDLCSDPPLLRRKGAIKAAQIKSVAGNLARIK